MKCKAYSLGESFEMQKLLESLINKKFEPKHFDDVIHIEKEGLDGFDIFYFPFGCVVVFANKHTDFKEFIASSVSDYTNVRYANDNIDFILYEVDEKTEKDYINMDENKILVQKSSVFMMLSVAYAIAQSVKLSSLEDSCNQLIKNTRPLQQELAKNGSVSLSKRNIIKRMGELFTERYLVNLHSEVLDTPEFFWRRPSYEKIYLMVADFQDLDTRQKILNKKLDIIQELYSILSNELNHINSSKLEIIVILLIAIEVLIGLSHLNLYDFVMRFC